MLFNLVSNGIKFKTEVSPVIDIVTAKEGDVMILSVEDNGIAMMMEDTGKIFGMYNRLHPSVEGQGIGLYLVKKIVHAAGGTITIETQSGKGSKFTVKLEGVL